MVFVDKLPCAFRRREAGSTIASVQTIIFDPLRKRVHQIGRPRTACGPPFSRVILFLSNMDLEAEENPP